MGERIRSENGSKRLTVDDLPDLTPNQSHYIHERLQGNRVIDAWRIAYPDAARTHKTESQWASASRVEGSATVRLWLSEARECALERFVETQESYLADCKRLREICVKSGNLGAAVAAQQLIGKASKVDVQTIEIRHDVSAVIARLEANNMPQLAERLRDREMKDITNASELDPVQ